MNFLDECIDALVGSHKYKNAHNSCKKEISGVMISIISYPERSQSHLSTAGVYYRKLNHLLEKYPVLQTERAEKELKEIRQDMCDFCKILKARRC